MTSRRRAPARRRHDARETHASGALIVAETATVCTTSAPRPASWMHLLLGNWLRVHPIGKVWLAPFGVVFSRFDVVEPDLLYVSNERRARILTEANISGHAYERAVVLEYWFVDSERDTVRLYRRAGERFSRS